MRARNKHFLGDYRVINPTFVPHLLYNHTNTTVEFPEPHTFLLCCCYGYNHYLSINK